MATILALALAYLPRFVVLYDLPASEPKYYAEITISERSGVQRITSTTLYKIKDGAYVELDGVQWSVIIRRQR